MSEDKVTAEMPAENEVITRERREAALRKLRPIELAEVLYKRGGHTPEQFAQDLWEHLFNGFVVSTPRHFMMYRAVMLDDNRHAWLITAAAGLSCRELAALLPFKLDCIAFYRRGSPKLKIYDYDRMIALANKR